MKQLGLLAICALAMDSCVSVPTPSKPKINFMELGMKDLITERYISAESNFKVASLERSPMQAEAFYYIGICRLKLNDIPRGITSLNQALFSRPDFKLGLKIHKALGEAYLAIDDTAKAKSEFQVLERAPEKTRGEVIRTDEYLFKLGQVYMRSGDFATGKLVLKKLIQEFPNSPFHAEAKVRYELKDYCIEVGRFDEKSKAEPLMQQLKKLGLVGSEIIFNHSVAVTVGKYQKYQDVQRELSSLKKMGLNPTPLP